MPADSTVEQTPEALERELADAQAEIEQLRAQLRVAWTMIRALEHELDKRAERGWLSRVSPRRER